MESLGLRYTAAYYDPESAGQLSAGAPLPPALRHLRVGGFLPGIQRAFAQLESLSIDMLLRENCAQGPLPTSLMEAAAQVRLQCWPGKPVAVQQQQQVQQGCWASCSAALLLAGRRALPIIYSLAHCLLWPPLQATRLTALSLNCPFPQDVGFFVHLAAATQLRRLAAAPLHAACAS